MRQIVFLTFALIFIVGHVHAHLIGHPSTEMDSYQFVAHHEVPDAKLTSGQGALKFRVLYTREHFRPEVIAAIDKAHGGFDVDRRQGKGETYFALPGVGIIQISADLKTTRLIKTPAALKKANAHYVTVWTTSAGTPYLSFPANDVGKIFTTTLEGQLVHTLETPGATTDFKHRAVNTYFSEGGKFVPTGVTHIDGMLYVTTGYSESSNRGILGTSLFWNRCRERIKCLSRVSYPRVGWWNPNFRSLKACHPVKKQVPEYLSDGSRKSQYSHLLKLPTTG